MGKAVNDWMIDAQTATIVAALVMSVASIITSIMGIIGQRRKTTAEARDTETDSEVKISGVTLEMYDRQKVHMDEIKAELKEVRGQMRDLRDANVELRTKMAGLQVELELANDDLKDTQRTLDNALTEIDLVLAWTNEYTPALKKAGIEPLDTSGMRFRGNDNMTLGGT